MYAIFSGGAFSDNWLRANAGLASSVLDLDVDNRTIPEPGAIALLGLVGLGFGRRRTAR